jgi:hypothetical protein
MVRSLSFSLSLYIFSFHFDSRLCLSDQKASTDKSSLGQIAVEHKVNKSQIHMIGKEFHSLKEEGKPL